MDILLMNPHYAQICILRKSWSRKSREAVDEENWGAACLFLHFFCSIGNRIGVQFSGRGGREGEKRNLKAES